MTGARSNSGEPIAKPIAGSRMAAVAMAPPAWTVRVMNRRRVTVSPSKAPGMFRSAVYLEMGCLRDSGTGLETLPPALARGLRPGAPATFRRFMVRARTAPDRLRASLPDGFCARRIALGVGLRAERDDVGELGHGFEVSELGEPLQAERVQAIAGQQRQVGILGPQHPPGTVVLQVALADRLDEQRIALALGGDRVAVRLRSVPVADDRGREQAPLRQHDL